MGIFMHGNATTHTDQQKICWTCKPMSVGCPENKERGALHKKMAITTTKIKQLRL
jgi:hypothetical protein